MIAEQTWFRLNKSENISTGCSLISPVHQMPCQHHHTHHNRSTALLRDHPGEPVPEENFWTLWCKGRLKEADIPTIRLGATPSGLTSAHLHHPPFFTGQMPFLPPNQQCQSTEGNMLLVYNDGNTCL